ncbi:9675_t:CDS:10, partial [Scutellospora calospora]
MTGYFYETSHEDWSLDGLAEWCAINISCDKKKLLDSMKKAIQDASNAPISEASRLIANSMHAKLEENLREIKEKEAIQLAQMKSHETVQLAEIKSKNLQEHTVTVVNFHKNIANDLTTADRKRKESTSNKYEELTLAEGFKRRTCGYDSGGESEEKGETEKVDDDSDDWGEIINFEDFSFDEWIDTCSEKRWCLNNGEKIRDTLIKITRQKIEEANQLAKVDGKFMSVIRLGLSSIIDLSSEFDGGMHTWFGDEWEGLKTKASEKICFEVKKFEGNILSDIIKIEELCASYRYWDARSFLLDKLKERPDDDKHQNPYSFINKKGEKKNLTEIEYITKVSGPILDIIFSNNYDILYLRWGETIPRPTVNRKIYLRVLSIDNNVDLSHSEFARKATPVKVIKDRSKCIRTNKCILDTYLMHNLPEEAIENSTFYGLQSAGLEGQIFGIDLLDDGLYFSLEGPAYRFPAQLNDINVLRNSLEVLYFFKENAINKAKHLSHNNNIIAKILHSGKTTTKPEHRKINFIKKTYFTPKESISNEIKT